MKLPAERLDLGREIVRLLDLDGRGDFISRWMAHYLAELMLAAEAPTATNETLSRCAEMILTLWSQRNDLPEGLRPFSKLEPIIETLRRLNPASRHPFYQPPAPSRGPDILKTSVKVDEAARQVIGFCLDEALGDALPEARRLSTVTARQGLTDPESVYIEFLAYGEAEGSTDDSRRRDKLQGQLAAARTLKREAAAVARSIQARIDALTPPPPKRSGNAGQIQA